MFPSTAPALLFGLETRRGSTSGDDAMHRYARGDNAAFGEVYDHVAPRVRSYVARRIHDPRVVDDVVQQVFLRIIEARGRFAPGCAVLPWAIAIAGNLVRDEARRTHRSARVFDPAEAPESRDTRVPAADDLCVANELTAQIMAVVAELPQPQRRAWELVRIQGLTQVEAARSTGSTVGAVKAACHRAAEAIRHALQNRRR